LHLRRRRRSGAVRETATIADTNTREKERNGEEYMACCGRTGHHQIRKRNVEGFSPRASLHEAVAAAWDIRFNKAGCWTLLRFLFTFYYWIVLDKWKELRVRSSTREKEKERLCLFFSQTRCICFCSVEHCSFL